MSSSFNDMIWGFVLFSAAAAAGVVASSVWPYGIAVQQDGTPLMKLAAWALGPRTPATTTRQPTPAHAPTVVPPRVEIPEFDGEEFPQPADSGDLSVEASLPALRPWLAAAGPGQRPRFTPTTVPAFWSQDRPGDGNPNSAPPSVRLASSRRGGEPSGPPVGTNSLQELLDRVKQLGAVVVRLESLPGTAGYFFRCEFPLGDGSPYHRFFQASDATPQQAVRRVLAEAERWKK